MGNKLDRRDNALDTSYQDVFGDISNVIEMARRSAARSVNRFMTAAYWLIGRRIIEFQQKGKERAKYGQEVIEQLARDLSVSYGRGFSIRNLWQMKAFYLSRRTPQLVPSNSDVRAIPQTLSAESMLTNVAVYFPLPWSAYVRLLSVKNETARKFYETEALRGGWSVRQLDRQINSQFYERTALSTNKAAMLGKGQKSETSDMVRAEEEIKDPYILEFLGIRDEYSESDLEEALIRHLETFLLELGGDFCFIGRQKRLRIGDEWYRLDLLLFHRRLRCLVIIDLKIGKFIHADAGQMHLYLNYVREHWMLKGENPPVGLILCAQKDEAVARYALEGLPNKVMASEYRTTLPDEKMLIAEIERTRVVLEERKKLTFALPENTDKQKASVKRQLSRATKKKSK